MADPSVARREVTVEMPGARLPGALSLPKACRGLVIFAHGSGSSRLSPRNRWVAEALNAGRLATLLFDLLTPQESEVDRYTAELRFDIGLLSERLGGSVDWVQDQPDLKTLPIGLFGASTGAAAALNVAAQKPASVRAVVSRGGRPDLARDALPQVEAPTLLLVGGLDEAVIAMNREAAERMRADVQLVVVPGATHLFEEPGTLESVADRAREWFQSRLGAGEG